jgi:lambda repressor-like predicted transcriptional regulator
MADIKKTLKEIRSFIRTSGIAPSRLAVMAGLSVNALRGVMQDDWSPQAATISKIQRAIKSHNRRQK